MEFVVEPRFDSNCPLARLQRYPRAENLAETFWAPTLANYRPRSGAQHVRIRD